MKQNKKLFLFLSVMTISVYSFGEDFMKCKAEDWEGKWYGDYYFESGTTFLVIVDIAEVINCNFKGTIYYPGYFNSKYSINGSISKDSLVFTEGKILQGISTNPDRGNFLMSINSKGLEGKTILDETPYASIRLTKASDLPELELARFEKTTEDFVKKYGDMEIGVEAEIEGKELLDDVRAKISESEDVEMENMEILGSMKMNDISFPIRMVFAQPELSYLEFEIQSKYFQNGNNGVVKWEYNPFEDALQVDSLSKDSDNDNSLSKFIGSLGETIDDGFRIVAINHAVLDSISAYRFLMIKEDNLRAFYIAKEDHYLIRQEIGREIELFFNYKTFDRVFIPTTYIKYDDTQNARFDFEEVSFDKKFDRTLFDIPKGLTHKIPAKTKKSKDYYNEGIELYNKGDYTGAKEQYTRAISINGNYASYYHERAKANLELNDYYASIADAQKAIELNDNEATYYNSLGLAKYRLGDYERALVDFGFAIEIDSTYGMAYYHKGLSFYYLNKNDSAFQFLSRAVEKDSTKNYFYLNHGIIGIGSEEYEISINSLKKALEMGYENRGLAVNWIGVGFYRNQQYDSAINYFKQAIELDPEKPIYQKNMGQSLYNLDKYKQAVPYLERVLKTTPDDHEVLNYLGLCQYFTEDYDGAIYYYDKAIDIEKDATYYDNRAYAKMNFNKYSGAIEDFTMSLQIYPNDPEIYYQRGLLHKLQHNNLDACKDFKRAIDLGHEKASENFKNDCKLKSDE